MKTFEHPRLHIIHGLESEQRHVKDARVVGRSEAILFDTKEAKLSITVSLKIQHHIDDMLEIFGASYLATLGDMSHDDKRGIGLFGSCNQLFRDDADLIGRTCWRIRLR